MNRFAIVLVACSLLGCAGAGVVAKTDRSITIMIGAGAGDPQRAATMAEQHCSTLGRRAQWAGEVPETKLSTRITYHCVP